MKTVIPAQPGWYAVYNGNSEDFIIAWEIVYNSDDHDYVVWPITPRGLAGDHHVATYRALRD